MFVNVAFFCCNIKMLPASCWRGWPVFFYNLGKCQNMNGMTRMHDFESNVLLCDAFCTTGISTCWVGISAVIVGGEAVDE